MCCWKKVACVLFIMCCTEHVTGQSCTMIEKPQTKGDDAKYDNFTQGSDLNECKKDCLLSSTCIKTEWKNGCFIANSDIPEISDPSSTLAVKICSTQTSTATTSLSPSKSTTVSQAGTCSHSQMMDTEGSDPDITLTLTNYDACQDACSTVDKCTQLAYDTNTRTCKLYASSTTTTTSYGSIFGSRQPCPDGCCYDRFQDKTGGNDQFVTLTMSLSSCEDICCKLDNCRAVSFTGSACQIYQTSPRTFAKAGVTTSLTSSTGGGSSTGMSITTACLSGCVVQPLTSVIALMSAAAWFVKCNI